MQVSVITESGGEHDECWTKAHSVYEDATAAQAACEKLNAEAPRVTYPNGKTYQNIEYRIEPVEMFLLETSIP